MNLKLGQAEDMVDATEEEEVDMEVDTAVVTVEEGHHHRIAGGLTIDGLPRRTEVEGIQGQGADPIPLVCIMLSSMEAFL